MALIVQKYGGAVLSDVAKIRTVAEHIADLHAQGNKVVVVVSAMGYTTDDLARLAYSVAKNPAKREMDMLLSVGERITMSLMAMAIEDTGKAKAVSFTGSQVGIITDTKHTEARIVEIRNERMMEALNSGKVVVVAGFQGVSLDKEITTLGRGGSDTTAVAIAAALNADRCDLVKEVPGIFSADPTIIPEAIPIPEMDYAGAIGLSLGGARILRKDCVALAERYGIVLRVGNSVRSTIIQSKTDKPYKSVTMNEGFTLYRFSEAKNIPPIPVDAEYVEIEGEAVIVAPRMMETEIISKYKPTQMREGLVKITVVGDDIGDHICCMDLDDAVEKVYLISYSSRQARIYFHSTDPAGALRRLHNKIIYKEGSK